MDLGRFYVLGGLSIAKSRMFVPNMRRVFIVLAVMLAVSGCAGPKTYGGAPGLTLSRLQDLPAPARTDLAADSRPYYIGPHDRLQIDVFGIPELSREVQADASGRISMPLVGTIEAAGSTPSELAINLQDKLRGNFVRDPQVTVNLKETTSQVITVDGEVKEPGLYPVIGRMTLTRAVATAKGTSEFAKLSEVIIFRTVNGQRFAGLYDLRAIREGRYNDPEVFANDIVEVGDSPGRRLLKTLVTAAPAFLTPIVYLLR